MNLLFPAAIKAAQLFCKGTSFIHSTSNHKASSCWIAPGSNMAETSLNHDNCDWGQLCEQAIKTGINTTPVIQHQNPQVLGIPFSSSAFDASLKNIGSIAHALSPDRLRQVRELYLFNSTFLN